jgi:hypothetical protein
MERRRFLGAMLGLAVAASGIPPFWKEKELEVTLYDVNGQTIFPVYSESGGLSMDVRSFLVAARDGRLWSYSFDPRVTQEGDAREVFEKQIKQAVISDGKYVMLPASHETFEIAA